MDTNESLLGFLEDIETSAMRHDIQSILKIVNTAKKVLRNEVPNEQTLRRHLAEVNNLS